MENIIKLMNEACLQNKESWITLFLDNGKELTGQIVDYNKDRVLIMDGKYVIDEDVLVIPISIIKYLACGEGYFKQT